MGRSNAIVGATFVATLGTAAIAAGIAVKDDGGNPSLWWGIATALLLGSLVIAALGLIRPWLKARGFWHQTDRFSGIAEWQVGHQPVPGGILLFITSLASDPLQIVMCELKRVGSLQAYFAYKTPYGETPNPSLHESAVYPRDFVHGTGGPLPLFDAVEHEGCYMQVWWAWDGVRHAQYPISWECFAVYGSGEPTSKVDQRCRKRCQAIQAGTSASAEPKSGRTPNS